MMKEFQETPKSSKRTVKKDYFPYFRIILNNQKKSEIPEGGFFLEPEEEGIIKKP